MAGSLSWLLLVLSLLQAAPPRRDAPQDPGELLLAANAAYEAGDFGRAADLYRALLAAGVDNGLVHYNLGNAHLRAGELGRAIAAYHRAQRLRPRDRDVAANLEFARQSARDALEPPGPSPVWETLFFWHHGLSPGELLQGTVAANLLFWSCLALRLYRRRSEPLRWTASLLLLLLLALGGSLLVRTAFPRRLAVVLPQEIEARSGTSADTVVRFHLQAGAEVRLVEEREGWLRIALPDGQQAWIEKRHAEVVEL